MVGGCFALPGRWDSAVMSSNSISRADFDDAVAALQAASAKQQQQIVELQKLVIALRAGVRRRAAADLVNEVVDDVD